MKQLDAKDLVLYQTFIDLMSKSNDEFSSNDNMYCKLNNAWWNLYSNNDTFALKLLFYLYSDECPFQNKSIFIRILKQLSDEEPEKCKAIIKAGLIEEYTDTAVLFDLLGDEDDDIDRCVINHLTKLILSETLKVGPYSILFLYEIRYRIENNEHALRYFEKYYGIKPELWSIQMIRTDDSRESKCDLSALDKYKIDFLADNYAD